MKGSRNAPEDGRGPGRKRSRKGLWIALILVLLLTIGGCSMLVIQQVQEQQAAAARTAAELAEAQQRAEEEARQAAERARRAAAVPDLEAEAKTQAQTDATAGTIKGEVSAVECTPITAGFPENLDQNTTDFDCFVTTSVDASGTPTGYHYQGSIDWTTGTQKIQYRPTT